MHRPAGWTGRVARVRGSFLHSVCFTGEASLTDVSSILLRLDMASVIDILLVSVIFYGLLTLIQGTQAVQLLRGIMIIVIIIVVVTSVFQLTAFSWLIRNSLPALLVAIPVVFQPELRRLLERLGRSPGGFLYARSQETVVENVVQTVAAASRVNVLSLTSVKSPEALLVPANARAPVLVITASPPPAVTVRVSTSV